MKGWKTWAAAAVIGVAAALQALGMKEWAEVALLAGTALGLVGIGHKVEKAGFDG